MQLKKKVKTLKLLQRFLIPSYIERVTHPGLRYAFKREASDGRRQQIRCLPH